MRTHRDLGSLLVLALALGISDPALARQNDCLTVIRELRDAGDCQITEAIPLLTWADGYTKWPGYPKGKWSEINSSGPCPKYASVLREIRVAPIIGQRQIVRLKAITRRVNMDGVFTGEYQVTKETYTCERRGGQWRIFSKVVNQRTDHENRKIMKRMGAAR